MQQNETQSELQEMQTTLIDQLYTPKDLAKRGIMSLVTQWKERERGRLKFYQMGRKILYSEAHIKDFLDKCERD